MLAPSQLANIRFKLDTFGVELAPYPQFGVDIAMVQQRLNELGANPPLSVDGANGPLTQQAIVQFQQSHGLEADGIVGPLTLTALGLSNPAPSQVGTAKSNSVVRVKGIEKLSKQELQALSAFADWMGVPVDWPATAISFETNGTFSPSIQNQSSHATGLIQFLPSTAKRLGTSIEALRAMTFIQQLEYVKKYFEAHRGKIHSMADFYLVIFYPAEVGKSPSDVVAYQGDPVYDQNAGFDRSHKGYITHDDIASTVVDKLNAALALGERIPIPVAVGAGVGVLGLISGVVAWLLFKKGFFG